MVIRQRTTSSKSEPIAEGSDQYEVVVGEKVVWRPACLENGESSKDRAEATAQKINDLLDTGITAREVCKDVPGGRILVNGTQVLEVANEDLLLTGNTNQALLETARSAMEYAIWADRLWTICQAAQERLSAALD